ncbi:actin-like protein 7B [Pongo pygmaeus]|uniref:ACTL7B isoform 1 n=1 Tax=Pongo abelii TaxID=9601 RepID=H2PSZ4_PONAB|nr:actin-like protein 7B [Pongo abelii]XP_054356295.1 actin-like protein 7B [Pongo pygmaeus]PNJ72608.1 ACTL7B isoform 1 [Pongo abelii]
MATRNSPMPLGTAQGDPGEAGTRPGPDAGLQDTGAATQLKMKPRKVHKIKAVIIDLGSQYCKCGYAGEPRPTYFISSTVGKRCPEAADAGDTRKGTLVGHELLNTEAPLKLVNPLKHGIVVDWDCVQDIWEYIFRTAMKILPEEHAVLVSDPPLSPSSNREKYAELMFETFGIPAMHVTSQSLLSIYSYGKTSGLVVESGHGVSHVVPISEGDVLPGLTSRADYAGSDLTNYLMQLLNKAGHAFTDDHLHIIEHIKKKCCYAAFLPEEELGLVPEELRVDYELPDGKLITIGQERFRCSEMLFQPSLAGSTQPGLPELTAACLGRCQDTGFKEEMAANVLLCGGCTMLDGFPERFQRELSLLCPGDSPAVAAAPERKTSVWTGGSILASLQAFQQLWVSKEEFQERGSMAIYSKC